MSPAMTLRRARALLLLILLIFLALAAGFSVVNPLFEAPDEQHHFFTARYIAQTGELPVVSAAAGLARQEAAQPPLYYALAALLMRPIDTAGAEAQLWPNPTVRLGEPLPTNVNAFVHTAVEAWPWQGYALAAHVLRLFSVALGAGTLLAIYGSARLLWPARPELAPLAAALVAFLPQFAFLHSAVSNDALIILLCSAALWQMLRLWLGRVTAVRLLLLGLTIGLAALTKLAGLLLLPLALIVLLLGTWRARRGGVEMWVKGPGAAGSLARLSAAAVLVIGPALALSGWLLWRNWTLYGDPTAVNQFVALAGGPRSYTLRQVWADLDRVLLSSIAFFGWMNVLPPRWVHALWLGIVLLAAGGGALAVARRRQAGRATAADISRLLAAGWLSLWVALVGGAWLRFLLQTPADQGRLLFPALLPLALFLAWGLAGWRQSWLLWLVPALAFLTSIYAVGVLLPGVYRPAAVLFEDSLPPTAVTLNAPMGEGLVLVGVEPPVGVLQPGDWAWVTLTWRADETPAAAPLERAALYGRANAEVGRQSNYHGGGTYPATEWSPGTLVRERLGVQVEVEAAAPAVLRLLLRITDDKEPREVARFKLVPERWPEVSGPALAELDDRLQLMAAEVAPTTTAAGMAVTVDLRWLVNEAPGRDLNVFLHLGDPAQAPLSQRDGPALGGDYPTGIWAADEVIDDRLELRLPADLPPGRYPLQAGLYDPQDGRRLPVVIDGVRQPQDIVPLGFVDVR